MKRWMLLCGIGSSLWACLSAQQTWEGRVEDEAGRPLPNVNIFLKETLEGTSSDSAGFFRMASEAAGPLTLCARMLGYRPWEHSAGGNAPGSRGPWLIRLRPVEVELGNVEVVASQFSLAGSSQWGRMNAVDLVTTAGSNGDLYRSIANLPGTQAAPEDGRLFVRGGDSREVQTYIDDLHVMNPYTTSGNAYTPVRGRYSPFMFEGMNFSLGGYDPEYAQGLSSVLPLSTKDDSPVSKYGTSLTTVGAGGGGTQAFSDGSVSLDLNYQNLAPYYHVFPDRTDWVRPYQTFSGKVQGRYRPGPRTLLKLYGGYDYTSLAIRREGLTTDLKEHNHYWNGTFRHQTDGGTKFFAGAAFSQVDQAGQGGQAAGDRFGKKEWEWHVKTKAEKRFSRRFRLQAGVESMFRGYEQRYRAAGEGNRNQNRSRRPGRQQSLSPDERRSGSLPERGSQRLGYSLHALFATAAFRWAETLSASVSSRLEYASAGRCWNYAPRVALTYNRNRFSLSAIAGRYTQLAETDYLLRNSRLPSESCWHYILGAYHQSAGRVYRAEIYYKNYDRLIGEAGAGEAAGSASFAADGKETLLVPSGRGYSKGADLYFSDAVSLRNFEYRLSYSWNDSKRKYGGAPVADVPQYATRHNASLCLRYSLGPIRSVLGATNRFASGRPYHDPNRPGYRNATTPVYNSLDLSLTFLASKKVIVYASASNILGQHPVYDYVWSRTPDAAGRYVGTPVRANADHFFFIGVFITLGGNTAYDVSNF